PADAFSSITPAQFALQVWGWGTSTTQIINNISYQNAVSLSASKYNITTQLQPPNLNGLQWYQQGYGMLAFEMPTSQFSSIWNIGSMNNTLPVSSTT
ncbi:MAG: hypothetical protein QXV17_06925, partial [Candidatus Micrarchaeaceae archaeon]